MKIVFSENNGEYLKKTSENIISSSNKKKIIEIAESIDETKVSKDEKR